MILLVSRGRLRLADAPAGLDVGLLLRPGNAPRVRPPTPWAAWFPDAEAVPSIPAFLDRLARRRHRPLFVVPPAAVRSVAGLDKFRARWALDFAVRKLPLGLPLYQPPIADSPLFEPGQIPWREFAWLVLAGNPQWTTSAAAAGLAAAAADHGVPLAVLNVNASSPRRIAARFGAAVIAGSGWSRLAPDSKPLRRLARVVRQQTLYAAHVPPEESPNVPTPAPARTG
jgi:hypothetical protein